MNKVLLSLAVGVAGLSGVAPAVSAAPFELAGAFREAAPDGGATHQNRIGVLWSTGDVYVADVVADQVSVYRPNDKYRPAGPSADLRLSFGSGDLADPYGIAIDQDSGDVYVSDDDDVVKYESDGADYPTLTLDSGFTSPGLTGPLAFDQASDELLVVDRATKVVRRYSEDGTAGATFDGSAGTGSPGAFEGLRDVAVDSTGDVLVVDSAIDPGLSGTSRVERYSAAGAWESTLGPVATAATVGVVPDSDDVIVSGDQDAGSRFVTPTLHRFDSAGASLGEVAVDSSIQFGSITGVAVDDGPEGRLHVGTDVAVGDFSGFFGRTSVQSYFAATPPAVTTRTAIVGEQTSKLRGTVNPKGNQTNYWFEYGQTTDYGISTPSAQNANAGAGHATINVQRDVEGLEPDTTYHYRLVAQNNKGTTTGDDQTLTTPPTTPDPDNCPNATIRTQQHAQHLPNCMAYEMVSPPDKNGGAVLHGRGQNFGLSALSSDGERATFVSFAAFADSQSSIPASYVATRTKSGWTTKVASPPPVKENPNVVAGDSGTWVVSDPALSYGVMTTNDTLDSGSTEPLTNDVYRLAAGEAPSLISQGNNGERPASGDTTEFVGVPSDASRVFFATTAHLVPGDANRTANADIYVRSGGVTSLVSRKSDGTAAGGCGAIIGGRSSGGGTGKNAISADGTSAYFTTPDPSFSFEPDCLLPAHIYRYQADGETIDVSASQRSAPDPAGPQPAVYAGASTDGARVVFQSKEMLTDDAPSGGGIYRFDVGTGVLSLLVGDRDARVLAVSDDAEVVYLLSSSTLDPGEGTPGAVGLYVYRSGTGEVAYIGEDPTAGIYTDINVYPLATSPAGDFVFGATEPWVDFDTNGKPHVYLYDLSDDRLACVSCDPAGQRPSTSPASGKAQIMPSTSGYSVEARPSFSADGSRLLFESDDRLTREDTNARTDVYVYADGRLSLISSGRSDQDSYAVGISADGDEVMFSTNDSLVGRDRDDGDQDMYVARVDGGFVEPVEPSGAAPCGGDGCQGAPRVSSPPAFVGSLSLIGGDEHPPVGRLAVRGSVAGLAGRLRVSVPGAGVVALSGTSVRPVRRRVSKAATYRLRVALSAKARKRLARRGSVKVAVRVVFKPAGGGSAVARRLSLKFKQPGKAKAARTAQASVAGRSNAKGGR